MNDRAVLAKFSEPGGDRGGNQQHRICHRAAVRGGVVPAHADGTCHRFRDPHSAPVLPDHLGRGRVFGRGTQRIPVVRHA